MEDCVEFFHQFDIIQFNNQNIRNILYTPKLQQRGNEVSILQPITKKQQIPYEPESYHCDAWVTMWTDIISNLLCYYEGADKIRLICRFCRLNKILSHYVSVGFKNLYLKKISTEHFKHLGDHALASLSPYITKLNVGYNISITDRGIKQLTNLTSLKLKHQTILVTDVSVEKLTQLKS